MKKFKFNMFVDNELYIIASSEVGSSELCHIKSGYYEPNTLTIYPGAILQEGQYDITMIGINWGGPYKFRIELFGEGITYLDKVCSGSDTSDSALVGCVWNKTVKGVSVKTPGTK